MHPHPAPRSNTSDHGDDSLLLAQYLRARDEASLRRIMERYMPMVYTIAHRTTGSHTLAAETSQDVFLKLSQNPLPLMRGVPLAAWLHRTSRTRSLDLLRAEKRRALLQEKLRLQEPAPSGSGLPEEGLALLDEVIDQLPAPDRNLVLQRFLFGESFVALSRSLGISEDAARMRINRALEKMRGLFARRGVHTTAAILATALPARGFLALPPKLLATTLSKASGAAAGHALWFHLFKPLRLMTSTQKYAVTGFMLMIAGMATAILIHEAATNRAAPNPAGDAASSRNPFDRNHPLARNNTAGLEGDANPGSKNRTDPKRGTLDEWIERWKKLPGNPDQDWQATDDQKSLIKNAVASLGCSEDLIGFIKFLKSVKCPFGQDLVNSEVRALAADTGRAAEIRASLIELANSTDKKADLEFLPPLIDAAGGACSKSEALEFSAALDNDGLKMAAMIGYDTVLFKTAPQEALIAIFEENQKRYDPATGFGPIPAQPLLSGLFEHLPSDVAFEEIEKAIPRGDGKNPNRDSDLDYFRAELFSHWAGADPDAAANYIMDHSGTVPETLMSSVFGGVLWYRHDTGIDWIKNFPEGKYYDAAIGSEGMLVGINENQPQLALELAERIQDQATRERKIGYLKSIHYPHDAPPEGQ